MKANTLKEFIDKVGASEKKEVLNADTFIVMADNGKDSMISVSAAVADFSALICKAIEEQIKAIAGDDENVAGAVAMTIADSIVSDLSDIISDDSEIRKTLEFSVHKMKDNVRLSKNFAVITKDGFKSHRLGFKDLTAGYFSIVESMIKRGKISKADAVDAINSCIGVLDDK